MGAFGSLILIVFLTFLPWVLWYAMRCAWLRLRERRVLQMKYGDLEMFAERLKEWNVTRGPKDAHR